MQWWIRPGPRRPCAWAGAGVLCDFYTREYYMIKTRQYYISIIHVIKYYNDIIKQHILLRLRFTVFDCSARSLRRGSLGGRVSRSSASLVFLTSESRSEKASGQSHFTHQQLTI